MAGYDLLGLILNGEEFALSLGQTILCFSGGSREWFSLRIQKK